MRRTRSFAAAPKLFLLGINLIINRRFKSFGTEFAPQERRFSQKEVRIAAWKAQDMELLAVCAAGDVYNNIARQLGYPENPNLFKTVVLGILYGLEAESLSWRVGIHVAEAAEILARLRARFRTFEYYCVSVRDHAGLDMIGAVIRRGRRPLRRNNAIATVPRISQVDGFFGGRPTARHTGFG